jgi:hypothetical protein
MKQAGIPVRAVGSGSFIRFTCPSPVLVELAEEEAKVRRT